jgi:serine/threonine protein phosphatase PrpC
MGCKSTIYPSTHADTYHLDLEVDDIMVMGSDGLFDNVFVDDIVSLLNSVSMREVG